MTRAKRISVPLKLGLAILLILPLRPTVITTLFSLSPLSSNFTHSADGWLYQVNWKRRHGLWWGYSHLLGGKKDSKGEWWLLGNTVVNEIHHLRILRSVAASTVNRTNACRSALSSDGSRRFNMVSASPNTLQDSRSSRTPVWLENLELHKDWGIVGCVFTPLSSPNYWI